MMNHPALLVGPCLVAIGVMGFLTRRNLILMFVSLELILTGVSINFIAFGQLYDDFGGQVFAIFALVVASCEAALALSIVVALVRLQGTLDVQVWSRLREVQFQDSSGSSDDSEVDTNIPLSEELEDHDVNADLPKLTPAGLDPKTRPIESDFKLPDLASRA